MCQGLHFCTVLSFGCGTSPEPFLSRDTSLCATQGDSCPGAIPAPISQDIPPLCWNWQCQGQVPLAPGAFSMPGPVLTDAPGNDTCSQSLLTWAGPAGAGSSSCCPSTFLPHSPLGWPSSSSPASSGCTSRDRERFCWALPVLG